MVRRVPWSERQPVQYRSLTLKSSERGSSQIRSFIDLRKALNRQPYAPAAWRAAIRSYWETAVEISDRWLPHWWEPFSDTSNFESERRLNLELADDLADLLDDLEDDSLVEVAGWRDRCLDTMEKVALSAAAWEDGEALLDRAWAQLPADLAEDFGHAVEVASGMPWPWIIGGGVVLGIGLLVSRFSR